MNKKFIFPAAILITLLVPALLFAGGQGEKAGQAEAAAPVKGPVSFTDHAGRPVELEAVPERVAAIASPAAYMMTALGDEDHALMATSPGMVKDIKQSVLAEFYPGLDNLSGSIISKDGSPNIEELLKLKSDVVLQWARNTKSLDALDAAGLTAVGLKYQKIDIAKTWLSTLGVMMEQTDKVNDILAWHQSAYKHVTDKTSSLADSEKPRVLFFRDPAHAAGPQTHIQFYIDTAGAKNVIEENVGFMGVDPEFVLKKNPDVIWMIGGNPQFSPDFFYGNPVYADVDAVKNHKIYKLPLSRWTPPGQEFPLSFEWFTRTVHPDLLGGSIRDSIKTAYPMLYGHEPSDAQIEKILGAKINKDALDYDKVIR